jgi:hypothetical protein
VASALLLGFGGPGRRVLDGVDGRRGVGRDIRSSGIGRDIVRRVCVHR